MRIACAYYSDTRALDETQIDALAKLLSRAEIERRDRLLRPHDRRDYTAAHGLLRVTLAAILDKAPQELTFASAKNGKPFRSSHEIAPSFSLRIPRPGPCVIVPGLGGMIQPVDDSLMRQALHRYFRPTSPQLPFPPTSKRPVLELWTLKKHFQGCGQRPCPRRAVCRSRRWSRFPMTQHPPRTRAVGVRVITCARLTNWPSPSPTRIGGRA